MRVDVDGHVRDDGRAAGIGLIWRSKLAHAAAAQQRRSAPRSTFLALATGSIWGKPMWGTWWLGRTVLQNDLLFLYPATWRCARRSTTRSAADRASAVLRDRGRDQRADPSITRRVCRRCTAASVTNSTGVDRHRDADSAVIMNAGSSCISAGRCAGGSVARSCAVSATRRGSKRLA